RDVDDTRAGGGGGVRGVADEAAVLDGRVPGADEEAAPVPRHRARQEASGGGAGVGGVMRDGHVAERQVAAAVDATALPADDQDGRTPRWKKLNVIADSPLRAKVTKIGTQTHNGPRPKLGPRYSVGILCWDRSEPGADRLQECPLLPNPAAAPSLTPTEGI